jgi:hypothetical protein
MFWQISASMAATFSRWASTCNRPADRYRSIAMSRLQNSRNLVRWRSRWDLRKLPAARSFVAATTPVTWRKRAKRCSLSGFVDCLPRGRL